MAFNLADVLKDVSNSDTGRDQIEYIRLDLIDGDANNFYQLSEIEGLADNIALCGLQQPIRVRRSSENPERYTIVSGHRRRAAIEMLAKDDPERWQEAACIVERDAASPALQQLRLIYANSSTRKLTPAEISEQAVQVEKLLYQLKEEEGYEFPGRMRDHVAQAVGQSRTKLARLKVIRENLADFWAVHFEDNSLHESTAYYLSQLSEDDQYVVYEYAAAKYGNAQRISCSVVEAYGNRLSPMVDLICPTEGVPCENMDNKKDATIRCGIYEHHPCGKCCAACYKLTSCRYACPKLAEQIAQQKAEALAQKRQKREAEAAKDAPYIEQVSNLWRRFALLREQAGKSVEDTVTAMGCTYSKNDDARYKKREQGIEKIERSTPLPFAAGIQRWEIESLIKLADLFNCSLDYLLCRTDEPDPKPAENVSKVNPGWQTGAPSKQGDYAVIVKFPYEDVHIKRFYWNGNQWLMFGIEHDPEIDGEIICWIQMPDGARDD